MSVTAQKRDIQDPEVVSSFAQKVATTTRLKYLYCLTTADIRATNDNLWNGWKGALLRELYSVTHTLLTEGISQGIDIASHIEVTQKQALTLLDEQDKDNIELLWHRFKPEYFVRHTPQQVAWHSRAILAHQDTHQPLVILADMAERDSSEIFIYTADRDNLFMHTVKMLSQKNLDVHDAQIMCTKDNMAMDTFVVLERDGKPLHDKERIDNVLAGLRNGLSKEIIPPTRTPRLPRQLKNFNIVPTVKYIASEKPNRTMLELVSLDRPGLLADVATLFHDMELSLHSAKISTVGERAEDFFSLSTRSGEALSEAEMEQLKTRLQHVADTSDF